MARRTNVTRHSYDPANKELTVEFHNGRRYRYSGVDAKKADSFAKAPSRGEFLHDHLIGKHPATELKND